MIRTDISNNKQRKHKKTKKNETGHVREPVFSAGPAITNKMVRRIPTEVPSPPSFSPNGL